MNALQHDDVSQPPADLQAELLQPATAGDPKMMETLDRINRRFGRGSISFT